EARGVKLRFDAAVGGFVINPLRKQRRSHKEQCKGNQGKTGHNSVPKGKQRGSALSLPSRTSRCKCDSKCHCYSAKPWLASPIGTAAGSSLAKVSSFDARIGAKLIGRAFNLDGAAFDDVGAMA